MKCSVVFCVVLFSWLYSRIISDDLFESVLGTDKGTETDVNSFSRLFYCYRSSHAHTHTHMCIIGEEVEFTCALTWDVFRLTHADRNTIGGSVEIFIRCDSMTES